MFNHNKNIKKIYSILLNSNNHSSHIRALSEELKISKPAIYNHLNKLIDMGLVYQKKKRGLFFAKDLKDSYQNIQTYAAGSWMKLIKEIAPCESDYLKDLEKDLNSKSAKMLTSQKKFINGRAEITSFWWDNADKIEKECLALINFYPTNILDELLTPLREMIKRYLANNKIPPKFKVLLRNNKKEEEYKKSFDNETGDKFLETRKLRYSDQIKTQEEIFVVDHRFAMTVHHNFETDKNFFSRRKERVKEKIASVTENPAVITALKKTFFTNWHFRSQGDKP